VASPRSPRVSCHAESTGTQQERSAANLQKVDGIRVKLSLPPGTPGLRRPPDGEGGCRDGAVALTHLTPRLVHAALKVRWPARWHAGRLRVREDALVVTFAL
jgi:hypothetical protein